MTDLIALEEYRPAWEIGGMLVPGTISQIEHGWEICMEDGSWVGVTDNIEWVSTDPSKDPVCTLWLRDGSQSVLYSADLVMSRRYQPDPKED